VSIVRARLLRAARWAVAGLLGLGLRLLPRRGHVVVYGLPATEGNAVEVVKALLRRYDGEVIWLDGPARLDTVGVVGAERLRVLPRLGLAAMARYLTADVTFFTHGLYGNPAPPRRRVLVNLWHGDGIKVNDTRMRSASGAAAATYVVGSTELLTRRKAADLGLRPADAIITGNPRTDQLADPPSAAALERLGLPTDAPFVVWMPTFRVVRQTGVTSAWADVAGIDEGALAAVMRAGAAELAERGITLAVRLHPLDAATTSVAGAVTLGDAELAAAGTTLYRVLGAAAALVSDYSSVVTDFLLLDRPLGFVVPDLAAYVAGRGVYPADAMDWLPGPVLRAAADFGELAEDVLGDGRRYAGLREAARQRLGLVAGAAAADALLTELGRREAARGRPLSRLRPVAGDGSITS
jgi:CDP-glycerol glycerophosphotransferase (TagB/SpsB family)